MLVLSRGPQDKVVFPNLGITVEILRISGNRVRVGVDAPKDVRILRHELKQNDAEGGATSADREANHRLRNRLNTAHLALNLMEKQLNAGQHDEALEMLHHAMREFENLDAEASPPNEESVETKSGAPRALLVEDNENESQLLAGYLRLSGFEVDTAFDGLQAMTHLARRDRPDVVLLDMHMPRMNGLQTVQSIRKDPACEGVRVFAVTGSEPAEMGVEIGPKGVDRWFQKPINPRDLVESLQADLAVS
ncbi:MAG: response regulator [Planctomycetales bacterium]|nr:response regulator [Planctomycetales bacterium]